MHFEFSQTSGCLGFRVAMLRRIEADLALPLSTLGLLKNPLGLLKYPEVSQNHIVILPGRLPMPEIHPPLSFLGYYKRGIMLLLFFITFTIDSAEFLTFMIGCCIDNIASHT